MQLDIKKLKQQLTLTDYEQILHALGADTIHKSNNVWTLNSLCHNKIPQDGGLNLRFYIDTKTFKCFSHDCDVGDIIALVQTRQNLLGYEYSFIDAVNFCIDNSNIQIDNIRRKTPKKTSNFDYNTLWDRYIKHENIYTETVIYDDNILRFFPKVYHQSFIDDNISIPTMEKYELCYYPRNQQVVIPVRDEDMQLIGLHSRNLIPDKVDIGLKYQPTKLLDGTEYKFPTSMVLYGLGQNKENIRKTRTAILVESPKGVLQFEDILECNNSVGLFGMSLSKYKRQLLLQLGVENFIIALDRQFKRWYNENKIDDSKDCKEFLSYINTVNKIIDTLRGYGNIYVVCDKECKLLDYKDSPSDKGREVWEQLWKERELVE